MADSRTHVDDPHNQAAEMSILGAVLVDNAAFERAADKLAAGDFYFPINAKLWATLAELIQAGRTADGVTLRELFDQDEDLQAVGGPRYLADLMASAAFGPEIVDYARLVRDLGARRRMLEAGRDLIKAARKGIRGSDAILADVQGAIDHLQSAQVTITPDTWRDSRMATVESLTAIARGTSRSAISTGIEGLDRKLGGLHRGELVVIGGRPSMGKTALIDQIETNVAQKPTPDGSRGSQPSLSREGDSPRLVVAKFALEMDHRQLALRNAARIAHSELGEIIPYEAIRRRQYTEKQWAILRKAMEFLPHVHWDDTPNIDLAHMRAQLTRLKRKYGRIDLITCDYLQIMEARQQRGENLAAALGRLTKGCKSFAREFDAPFVLLSQLTKDVDRREDKRPQIADLRDSGSIEADADVVAFIFREYFYLSREPEPKDQAKRESREATLQDLEPKISVLIPKIRMGQPGDVDLFWNAATSWIVSERRELYPDRERGAAAARLEYEGF